MVEGDGCAFAVRKLPEKDLLLQDEVEQLKFLLCIEVLLGVRELVIGNRCNDSRISIYQLSWIG